MGVKRKKLIKRSFNVLKYFSNAYKKSLKIPKT